LRFGLVGASTARDSGPWFSFPLFSATYRAANLSPKLYTDYGLLLYDYVGG
jgi:hypothetical protein